MLKFVSIVIDKLFELTSLCHNIRTNGFISAFKLLKILSALKTVGIDQIANLEANSITKKLI